jgi:hypothetical protein
MVADPLQQKLLVFGGWDRVACSSELWEFSLRESRWTRLTTNIEELHGGALCQHSMVIKDRKAFIFGGFSTQLNDFSNSLYSIAI